MAYTTLNASYSADLTLTAGTYYLSANCDMNSYDVIFDQSAGDIILKRNGDVYFQNVAEIDTTNYGSYTTYLTVKDDDSIGESISGSSGSPSVSGGTFCDNVLTSDVDIRYMEIRWVDNVPFLVATSKNKFKNLEYITWKNSVYSSVIGVYFAASFWDTGGTGEMHHLDFDATNTLSGTANLIYQKNRTDGPKNIFIENSSSLHSIKIDQYSGRWIDFLAKNIRIKNTSGYGVWTELRSNTTGTGNTFENCSFTLDGNAGATSKQWVFKNCLFDDDIHGGGSTYVINRSTGPNAVVLIDFQRCIFNNNSNILFHNYEYGGNKRTYLDFLDCIFSNNAQLLFGDDLGHQTSDYCGYYNNTVETWWTKGANAINEDPTFITAPSGCVIDTTFEMFISDGYFVSNANYFEQGSDTYNNLSIDESEYTATGAEFAGTANITPGIQYLVTAFASSSLDIELDITAPLATFEITTITENQISLDITAPIATFESDTITENKIDLSITAPIAQFELDTKEIFNIILDITAPIATFDITTITENDISLNITAPIATVSMSIRETEVPVLTLITNQIRGIIEALSTSTGYLLNWGPIDYEDRALEDLNTYNAYGVLIWDDEINYDVDRGAIQSAFSNYIDYTLNVRVPLDTESNKANYDVRPQLYKGLCDIKHYFGHFPNIDGSFACTVMYLGSKLNKTGKNSGDRFCPITLDIKLRAWYFQYRADVYQIV